jgi:hypothetical protein
VRPSWCFYNLYGLTLQTQWALPVGRRQESGPPDVVLAQGFPSAFLEARREAALDHNGTNWLQWIELQDGTSYLRWGNTFEFLVSADGRRISGLPLVRSSLESFSTYLLSQVFSFALLKQGVEPLHATVIAAEGGAIAFIGDSGYGKSSIGAAFLQAGYRLLTDDLLVLKPDSGKFCAYPGPPRIKLFPEIARAVLGERFKGVPMNPLTPKLIIPLDADQHCDAAIPLRAIYALSHPSRVSKCQRVSIRRLSERRAFLALLQNTFNTRVVEPERLKRQFALVTQLAQSVPIKRLCYPRDLRFLELARAAVLSDISPSRKNGSDGTRRPGTHVPVH